MKRDELVKILEDANMNIEQMPTIDGKRVYLAYENTDDDDQFMCNGLPVYIVEDGDKYEIVSGPEAESLMARINEIQPVKKNVSDQ